jgi:hypothetical protein
MNILDWIVLYLACKLLLRTANGFDKMHEEVKNATKE